ncbi:hypothetical protein [Methylobacterium sp. A54F]
MKRSNERRAKCAVLRALDRLLAQRAPISGTPTPEALASEEA